MASCSQVSIVGVYKGHIFNQVVWLLSIGQLPQLGSTPSLDGSGDEFPEQLDRHHPRNAHVHLGHVVDDNDRRAQVISRGGEPLSHGHRGGSLCRQGHNLAPVVAD